MTKKLIDRLINKEYLTDRERREWLNQVKNDVILLETQNESLKDEYDILKFNLEEKVEVISDLKKENQELKIKADKYDSAQRIVLSTKGIDVIMKLQAKNEKLEKENRIKDGMIKHFETEYKKLEKAIEILKQFISLDLECNIIYEIRMGREMIVISQQEYELLKEVLGE